MLHLLAGCLACVCHSCKTVVESGVHLHVFYLNHLAGFHILIRENVHTPARGYLHFGYLREVGARFGFGRCGVGKVGLQFAFGRKHPCQLARCRRINRHYRFHAAASYAKIEEFHGAVHFFCSEVVHTYIIIPFLGYLAVVFIFSLVFCLENGWCRYFSGHAFHSGSSAQFHFELHASSTGAHVSEVERHDIVAGGHVYRHRYKPVVALFYVLSFGWHTCTVVVHRCYFPASVVVVDVDGCILFHNVNHVAVLAKVV